MASPSPISMPAKAWRASMRSSAKAWPRSSASASWPPAAAAVGQGGIGLPHRAGAPSRGFHRRASSASARELQALAERHHALAPVFTCKRLFVQRQALKAHKPEAAAGFDGAALTRRISNSGFGEPLTELAFARKVNAWMAGRGGQQGRGPRSRRRAMPPGRRSSEAGRARAWRRRAVQGAAQARSLCIWCRWRPSIAMASAMAELDRPSPPPPRRLRADRSRHGSDRRPRPGPLLHLLPSPGEGFLQPRAEGARRQLQEEPLPGDARGLSRSRRRSPRCTSLKAEGVPLGALAMIVVDNPMVAATGHRICNDCMKACIYQKQEPVDIPQAETRTLKDILELPWGFEIYGLLTRWNPLNLRDPLAKPDSGKKVLVVGLGPAGFTLVALHAERRPCGGRHRRAQDRAAAGGILRPHARRRAGCPSGRSAICSELHENLDDRAMAGFGGVAEYGITVRWDKNFLKIIRLLIERRAALRHVRRRALRRHADLGAGLRARLRPCGALPGRGQAHDPRSCPMRWRRACAWPRISSWPCS